MTGKQFEQAIRALGYNQSSFARAISHNVRTVQSWRQGRLPVPPQIAMLVKLMTKEKPDTVANDILRLRDEIRQLKQKPCPACGWPGWQK